MNLSLEYLKDKHLLLNLTLNLLRTSNYSS
jgi:hypothetical protein